MKDEEGDGKGRLQVLREELLKTIIMLIGAQQSAWDAPRGKMLHTLFTKWSNVASCYIMTNVHAFLLHLLFFNDYLATHMCTKYCD
jgi:hypothetical protein